MVVERQLNEAGENRREIGREAFVERVWRWKEQSGGTISRQMRRLGNSVDWSRDRFTMDEGRAKGISSTMVLRAQGMESIATVRPAPISIASIQTGVEITNLTTTVQGSWRLSQSFPIVEIKEFQCNLFGGTVTSPGLTMDLDNPVFQATLSLHDLDLAKVLSVEQNPNLQGTGTLGGTVPVSVTQAGITVKDGLVTALPPAAIIRYGATPDSSKAISDTNSQLHLVTQALNNFHYTLPNMLRKIIF